MLGKMRKIYRHSNPSLQCKNVTHILLAIFIMHLKPKIASNSGSASNFSYLFSGT
jgi:hypothetical protein